MIFPWGDAKVVVEAKWLRFYHRIGRLERYSLTLFYDVGANAPLWYVYPVSCHQVIPRNADDVVINVVTQPGFGYTGNVQICIYDGLGNFDQLRGQRHYVRHQNRWT